MFISIAISLLSTLLLAQVALAQGPFVHPGGLHTQADLDRMAAQVAAGAPPWVDSWNVLVANPHASLGWRPRPVATVIRGGTGENYSLLYNDTAAAYACALRWYISGDIAYADKAVEIMNAWSYTLTTITGTSDKFLASGIYGYQFANAAEIMRLYDGWAPEDFAQFQNMMLTVFYPMNHDFLVNHNGACISHYWCNWDASNMASMISIGVLCDREDIFSEAVDYYENGPGNGSIWNAVYSLYPDNLGQWQESGRDQAHSMLGLGLLATVCEVAWNQGIDLYGYADNRLLAGAEYIAKYNLGYDVPYTPYDNCDHVNQTTISAGGRGNIRPIWEQIYNHYVNRMGLVAPYTQAYAELVRPEGGGGNYGSNSGGYDHLGYGTLTFTRPPPEPSCRPDLSVIHIATRPSDLPVPLDLPGSMSDASLEPRHDGEIPSALPCPRSRDGERHPEIRLVLGRREPGWHHTDDRAWFAVDHDRLPKDRWIAPKP